MKKNKKRRKLSTNFMLTSILPASALMIFVCAISIMITSTSIIKGIKRGIEGQSTAKTISVIKTMKNVTSPERFTEIESEFRRCLENGSDKDICDRIMAVKSRTSFFRDVVLYDISSGIFYNSEESQRYSELPEWFDSDKFRSGEPYFVSHSIVSENGDAELANENEYSLLTYVYQFSSRNDGIYDCCVISEVDNTSFINAFELSVSVSESKWMIFSDEGKIIYHPLGYNKEIFDEIESLMVNHNPDKISESFQGRRMALCANRIEELGGIMVLYVVPVDAIIRSSIGSIILIVVLTVACIAILAFYIRLMTREIVKEISTVRECLKGIREKKFTEASADVAQEEMGELVDDFNEVIYFLTYQAEHDENTGFYNAGAFAKKSQELIYHDRGRRNFAVIRVDIDNFSFINDIFDWEVGNSILVKISGIIKTVFHGDAVHGYLGNDIFTVLVGYKNKEDVTDMILEASDQIKQCETRINLVPHFGLYDNVRAEDDISVVCDCAGVALKTVKGSLLQVYAEYDARFRDEHNTQMFVESSKQRALFNREFFIQLQPKCDITTGEVVGAESLVRWRIGSTGQILPPSRFIPIFEKNDFILSLDKYVWEETCRAIRSWKDRGFREIPVSVNVSRVNIKYPGFVDYLENLTRKYGIRPELLEIEITESALVNESEFSLEDIMNDLKSRGFRLLMDDFAQGYSSLLALQNMPFDVIKIDKALIDNIEIPEKRRFVQNIVSFLFGLDKEIVVEGVESYSQKAILRDAGCRVIQGYLFSRPLDINDFEVLAFGGSEQRENA